VTKNAISNSTICTSNGYIWFDDVSQDLREAFELEARDSGRERLLLTMAAAGGSYYIELAYETRHIVR